MTLLAPLYCAMCAAPCYLPRRNLPPPNGDPPSRNEQLEAIGPIAGADTTSTPDSDWLHEWHVLRVGSGLIPIPDLFPTSETTSSPPNTQRMIPLHHYCLAVVLKTIRRSMYNTGYSHEESCLLGWSLPKWTGYGPWVNESSRGGFAFLRSGEAGGGGGVGYWRGCTDQRNRWEEGREGSHLLPVSSGCPSKPHFSFGLYHSPRPDGLCLAHVPRATTSSAKASRYRSSTSDIETRRLTPTYLDPDLPSPT